LIDTARGKGKRIVFFIDDLDRCQPEQVLRLLEALKLYLNVEDCVYVLGVDHAAVKRAIERQYGKTGDSDQHYLDKIVQIPFLIPRINPEKALPFIESLLPEAAKDCAEYLVEVLGDNPRQVKRFVNTLSLNMVLASESFGEGETFSIPMLVALLLIQYRRENLFRQISLRPGLYADLTVTGDDAAKLTEEYFRGDGLLQRLVQTIGCPVDAADLPHYVHLAKVGGATVRDKQSLGIEPEMVAIERGKFVMGSVEKDREKPPHEVKIGRRFLIGKYPVTFAEYDAFCEASGQQKPNDAGWGREQRPVVNVSWEEARAYVKWLSSVAGKLYRLPTEAEWEYCCRADTTTKYSCGDKITETDANFGKTDGKTTEVGAYPANPWGLHDMHGNVWEWVEDVWHENYEGAPDDGSAWTEGGDQGGRVLRGGSWFDKPDEVRSAHRRWGLVNALVSVTGFRIAQTDPLA
jgi:formylglycine-generating enzyme required for sulfatase activity